MIGEAHRCSDDFFNFSSCDIMKNIIFSFFFLLITFFTISESQAQAVQTPRYLHLQAILVDDGGNVLYDVQESDITFSIIDGVGDVLYTEIQNVIIINGAISVLIGQGKDPETGQATGGIPLEALSPDEDKLIRFQLSQQSVPQEVLKLASVPYSYYADVALSLANPITSEEVEDGSLQLEDLSENLLAELDRRFLGEGGLSAESVSINNRFVHAAGGNLMEVLENIDHAIESSNRNLALLSENLERVEMTVIQDSDRLDQHVNAPVAEVHPNGDWPAGRIDGALPPENFGNDSIPDSALEEDYVNTRGDTMTGHIQMNDAECIRRTGEACTVDGVDLSDVLGGGGEGGRVAVFRRIAEGVMERQPGDIGCNGVLVDVVDEVSYDNDSLILNNQGLYFANIHFSRDFVQGQFREHSEFRIQHQFVHEGYFENNQLHARVLLSLKEGFDVPGGNEEVCGAFRVHYEVYKISLN